MFAQLSRDPRVLAVVIVAALAIVGIGGIVLGYNLHSGGSDANRAVIGAPTTSSASPSAASPTRTAVATPSAISTATSSPAAATAVPSDTPTPLPTDTPAPTPTPAEPHVQVNAIDPSIGSEITAASVPITVDVDYQAGAVSNVLGWTLYYCFSPIDCNTFGLDTAYDVVPGSQGSARLQSTFAPGANGLRPAVICQLTVTIGHFLTPEAHWQSQLAANPRCHPDELAPTIKVTDVQPPLGSTLASNGFVTVNLEYDAGPATKIWVGYYVSQCAGDLFAVATRDVTPGTSGITTIQIGVTAQSAGHPLHHVEAQLRNGDATIATYAFGPC